MTLEWVPGAGIAVIAGVLSWWKNSAVAEEKVVELRTDLNEVKANLSLQKAEYQALRESVGVDLRESYERFSTIFTEIKVLAATQGEFNRFCTKTLEGIVSKQDSQETSMMRHATEIAILKAATKMSD